MSEKVLVQLLVVMFVVMAVALSLWHVFVPPGQELSLYYVPL
jgi:hypothetical protein